MNLKTFHLVFIACSSALAFLFGLWMLNSGTFDGLARLAGSVGAFALCAGLIVYEAWFLRYSKGSR